MEPQVHFLRQAHLQTSNMEVERAVNWRELQDNPKAAGTTNTQRSIMYQDILKEHF